MFRIFKNLKYKYHNYPIASRYFYDKCISSGSNNIETECVVIGAGVIGLSIAREIALRKKEVLVMEKADKVGTGISSRNSEVIHGGLYYKTNSLKALMCVEGRKKIYNFCDKCNVPYKKTGKLIVANSKEERKVLKNIIKQAKINGVHDVEEIDSGTIKNLEPSIRCTSACYSPSTGIIDSQRFMDALYMDAEKNGAIFMFGCYVKGGDLKSPHKKIFVFDKHNNDDYIIHSDCIINSAGLYAWDVAKSLMGYPLNALPMKYYARGCYFSLSGHSPFSHLIYPIPSSNMLGIHLTIDISGKAKFGPDIEWIPEIDYTLKLERVKMFYESIRKYYPSLSDNSLKPDYVGIRPKINGPTDTFGDFLIQNHQMHGIFGLINLFGIESPGLTSSMAIGEYVAEMLD